MNVNDTHLAELNAPDLDLSTWLQRGSNLIEDSLAAKLPAESTQPSIVHQAMRYAVLGGGKRLRPLLTIASAQLFGACKASILPPALAVEIFHAYTLVHDDLPCMDDDALRRGKPSTHIAFGEANALLAGDALLTLACQWCAEAYAPLPHTPSAYVLELTRAGGSQGVIGGQIEDLAAEGQPPNAETLGYIHREKTARLLSCACRMGGIAAGACESRVDLLGRFGMELGLAFQIQDDILDHVSTTEELGKPVGSDEDKEKMTYVALMGLDAAREEAALHTKAARELLAQQGWEDSRLAEIASHLLRRRT